MRRPSPKMVLSRSEFAEVAGVSRQAVVKALKRHWLVLVADGRIDLRRSPNREYVALHRRTMRMAPEPEPDPAFDSAFAESLKPKPRRAKRQQIEPKAEQVEVTLLMRPEQADVHRAARAKPAKATGPSLQSLGCRWRRCANICASDVR